MRRGPKPKPYLMKLAEGNPGRRKLVPSAEVPAGYFAPPMRLSGIARKEWNRVLSTAHWLRETEAVSIADRCLCVQRVQEAEALVRAQGMIIQGSRGAVTNPAVRIAKAYRTAVQRYDAELGLTASSRAGMPSNPLPNADGIEAALCGDL